MDEEGRIIGPTLVGIGPMHRRAHEEMVSRQLLGFANTLFQSVGDTYLFKAPQKTPDPHRTSPDLITPRPHHAQTSSPGNYLF